VKTIIRISIFSLLVSCETTSLLRNQFFPTDTTEKVYESQELKNRVTDIQYETNWTQIPTSEDIIEKIDSYVTPNYKCGHIPEQTYADYSQVEEEKEEKEKEDQESPLGPETVNQKMKANFEKLGGDPIALDQAICFLSENQDKNFNTKEGNKVKIKNKDYMVIQDFTKPSSQKRFFLINRNTGDVEVMSSAHGMGIHDQGVYNSVVKPPEHFSNSPGSKLSPRGFMITSDYQPSNENWEWHMKFDGIQKGINDNTRSRAVVFHPGYKKSVYTQSVWEGRAHSGEDPVNLTSSLNGSKNPKGFEQGMTEGCTAVAPEYAKEVYNKTKGGALYYNYTQTEAKKGSSYCGEAIR
jgi:hypothetical protein